jgi:hypothetical protein
MLRFLLHGGEEEAAGTTLFSKPEVTMVSARCAAVEFTHGDNSIQEVYVFAKRPKDNNFIQWGNPLEVRHTEEGTLRILLRNLPVGSEFQVLLSSDMHWDEAGSNSPVSEKSVTHSTPSEPHPPMALHIHRTDPRMNHKWLDGSICVDLHWTHPHTVLHDNPHDIYFRISHEYIGEHREEVCTDEVGEPKRKCGTPIPNEFSQYPESYMTLCGLRPDRHIRFDVEAFDCDGESVVRHIKTVTPPSAPSVIVTLVTEPAMQESIAGFQPMAVVDWIPQHDDRIEGHAVYLGLTDISAQKLLCYLPHDPSDRHAKGHLEVPIMHKNYTSSEHKNLLMNYLKHAHVHQKQEIRVTTRVKGKLESPAFVFRLGDWLVMDMVLKCLTSFEADRATYVSYPVIVSWTQEQGMTLYD